MGYTNGYTDARLLTHGPTCWFPVHSPHHFCRVTAWCGFFMFCRYSTANDLVNSVPISAHAEKLKTLSFIYDCSITKLCACPLKKRLKCICIEEGNRNCYEVDLHPLRLILGFILRRYHRAFAIDCTLHFDSQAPKPFAIVTV
jgi:hypothetical protein